jgi:Domain of unknown function (DUF4112)
MKAREIEIDEVLPKGARRSAKDDPLIAFIARLMDDWFVIPGTNLRFGLDPLLGLLPGWGDSASALVSALLILKSARARVPKIVLARMALNILLNAAIGAIPGIGDAFSFWFKSNAKNHALHLKHAGTARPPALRDRLFVAAILGTLFTLLAVFFFVTIGLAVKVLHWIAG